MNNKRLSSKIPVRCLNLILEVENQPEQICFFLNMSHFNMLSNLTKWDLFKRKIKSLGLFIFGCEKQIMIISPAEKTNKQTKMDLFIRALQVTLSSKGSLALFIEGTLWSRKVFCPFSMSHQTVFCVSLRLENHWAECTRCTLQFYAQRLCIVYVKAFFFSFLLLAKDH